jgi:tetratricopeptide (TPR) repeat protein
VWLALFGVAVAAMVAAGGLLVVQFAQDARRQRDARREEELRRAEEAEREADRAEARDVFTDPLPPSPDDAAAFLPLFDSFGQALGRGDGAAAVGFFDLDRMFDQLDRAGAFERIAKGKRPTDRDRADFKRGATTAFGRALTGNPFLRWTTTTIRRVRWSADRGEAVVIAVHRDDADDFPSDLKMRWWLVSTPTGWKIYDLEELDVGYRFSFTIGQLMTPEVLADPLRFKASGDALRAAMIAVKDGDPDGAEKALEGFTLPDPPAPMAAVRALVEGMTRVLRGDYEGGLKFFDRAAALNPDMPVVHLSRALALARWGKFEDSLAEGRKYVAHLGPDPVVSFWEGYCLEGLGRDAEAADAYRRALDDAPAYHDALHGLRRVLPPDRKGELAERLTRMKKPMPAFDALLADARKDRDDAGAEALLGWLRKTHPDDQRAVLSDIRNLVRTGQFTAATFRVRSALAKAAAADREDILTAYLLAMLDADRPVEAYAGVPPAHARAAFRILASELEERFDEGKPDQPDPAVERLTQLVAAHRKQQPDDPWLGYYEGVVLQQGGKLAEAEAAFAAGQAKLNEQAGVPEDERKAARESFRYRRVECLYGMKEGLRAYAEVGPPVDTFRQLAYRYMWDRDEPGLSALIAAHAKAVPDDPLLAYWRAEVRYLRAEYEEAADGFAAYLKTAREKDPERFAATEKQIRSLIRSDQPTSAKLALMKAGEDRVAVGLRAAVLAAAGDRPGLEDLLAARAKVPGGLHTLYNDPDFERLIADEKFATLRQMYPDPRAKAAK